jgi:hypothetical protein
MYYDPLRLPHYDSLRCLVFAGARSLLERVCSRNLTGRSTGRKGHRSTGQALIGAQSSAANGMLPLLFPLLAGCRVLDRRRWRGWWRS